MSLQTTEIHTTASSSSGRKRSAFTQPPSVAVPHRTLQVRPLLALETPPVTLEDYPHSPSQARTGSFLPELGYDLSTHVFPAAWPRCPSESYVPPSPTASTTGEQTSALLSKLADQKRLQEDGRDERSVNRNVLWTVANRIFLGASSATQHSGLTLVMLHGIGGHKESWEPTIKHLLSSHSRSQPPIVEVWVVDSVQHGDSGLLNESSLGDTFDCADYSRDLLNFLKFYLPSQASGRDLPMNLLRLSDSLSAAREQEGVPTRTLVGVGHSIGACAFIPAAVLFPDLLSFLILVESFTVPEYMQKLGKNRKYELSCMKRQWAWESRTSAVQSIRSNPYYRSWHPDVLETFLQRATTASSNDEFHRLKTHPHFESIMLLERLLTYETYQLITSIPSPIPIHWIWGGKSTQAGGETIQAQVSFRRGYLSGVGSRDSNVVYEGVGHMFPQEAPEELGKEIADFLASHHTGPRWATSKL